MSDNAQMTITEFLEARISEDEALAVLVVQDAEDRDLATWEVDALEVGGSLPGPQMTARFSPARVLAECAAKRARLKLIEDGWISYNDDNILGEMRAIEALPYKYHPDYREEWAL